MRYAEIASILEDNNESPIDPDAVKNTREKFKVYGKGTIRDFIKGKWFAAADIGHFLQDLHMYVTGDLNLLPKDGSYILPPCKRNNYDYTVDPAISLHSSLKQIVMWGVKRKKERKVPFTRRMAQLLVNTLIGVSAATVSSIKILKVFSKISLAASPTAGPGFWIVILASIVSFIGASAAQWLATRLVNWLQNQTEDFLIDLVNPFARKIMGALMNGMPLACAIDTWIGENQLNENIKITEEEQSAMDKLNGALGVILTDFRTYLEEEGMIKDLNQFDKIVKQVEKSTGKSASSSGGSGGW